MILTFFCTVTLIFALFLDISGPRKNSCVLVDEFHSDWESTERPFETTWYGEKAGYNYAVIYDYCSRFFTMDRLNKTINNKTLENCDVLILKVPTSPYTADEIKAIKSFVKNGGGLLLIAEHTDVYYTSSYLNDIAIQFGFEFRSDSLLGIDTSFEQLYTIPFMAHPILQHLPHLDFAVSCSIEPKSLFDGRSVITSLGLRSLHADYHASNFYPQLEDYANARFGAFIQLWTKQYGKGRLVAFTDSTIFSNFSIFEPGKSELMLGMIEWLNHRNPFIELKIPLLIMSLLLFIGMLFFVRYNKIQFFLLISITFFGWVVSVYGIRWIHSLNMPIPQQIRPFVKVNIDRSICDAPLSKSGFIKGAENGFGIFEQWILRLGYFTQRISEKDNIEGDLLIFLHPDKDVTEGLRNKLVQYVNQGGKVLLIDSPINKDSKANSLLYPFGIKIDKNEVVNGILKAEENWPIPDISPIDISSSYIIDGGRPILTIKEKSVGVTLQFGKGSVTVLGFGSRFTDAHMGTSAEVIPDKNLRAVFDLEFSILRWIIEN